MDRQIRILGIFQEPFIRKRIATDNHFHPAKFKRVAYRPIAGMHRGPGTNRHSVLLIHHLVDSLVVELGGLDIAGYRADHEFSRGVIPVGVFQEIVHRVLGTQFRGHATWTPDPERVWTTRRPAAGPQSVDVTHMVGMQMRQKNLVQKFIRDHQGGEIRHGPAADIEYELVAIARFHQVAGCGLTAACSRHAGAAGDHTDFVFGQRFRTGVVDVTIRRDPGRVRDGPAGGECRASGSRQQQSDKTLRDYSASSSSIFHFNLLFTNASVHPFKQCRGRRRDHVEAEVPLGG